jgi:hypothetical protein
VRGLAAAGGEDALGGDHAVQVVRVGLAADQDDLLAGAGPLDRGVGVEDGLADGRARRGGDAPGHALGLGGLVEAGEHQLRQLRAVDPVQRLVQVDHALVHQLDGDPEGGGGGALADPGLEHPQLAALDGELDVAEVLVVALQRLHDPHELVVAGLVEPFQVRQLDGVPDPGHHVLALGVLQVVAVDAQVAAGRVAGEGDAGAGVGAEVAEHHGADVDGGGQVAGDALLAAVELGPVAVPAVEDGVDGEVHLLARVLREVPAGVGLDDALEGLDDLLQVGGVQVQVVTGALGRLRGLQRVLEQVALDAQHGLAEHLDQPTVGVPGEAVVTGLRGQALHRGVGEADVEDGVHHPGHRELGPGTDRDEQRVGGVAELLAHLLFQRVEVRTHLVAERGGLGACLQVDLARLGGDGEPGRDGKPEVGHLSEVRALAAEQILQVPVALGEVVDEFLLCRHGFGLLPHGCPDAGEHTQIEGGSAHPIGCRCAVPMGNPIDRKRRIGVRL